jgi:restriction endonuclease S subunit
VTATKIIAPRVFGVWWKDLDRWVIPTNILLGQSIPPGWMRARISTLVRQVTERVKTEPEKEYKMAGVRWYGEGVFHRETVRGDAMSASQVTPLVAGALIYNRLFAWKASFAVVPPELADCYVSSEFPQFIPDTSRILSEYLYLFCTREATIRAVNAASTGSSAVSRNRFKEEEFLNFKMSLPPLAEQKAIVDRWRKSQDEIAATLARVEKRKAAIDARFLADLGLRTPVQGSRPKAFAVWWKEVERWGTQLIYLNCQLRSESKFRELLLSEICKIGSGGTPQRSDKRYFGGSIPWVKTTEVRNEEITSTEESLTNEGLRNSSARVYPKGSLLIAMYGQGATRGRTAKLAIDAATNQACAVLYNIHPRIETDFLWYFLMSQYVAIRALASGNNQPNLNAEMIANLRIPLPPLAVQKQIMDRVAAGREEIARERETADRLARDISAEIEGMILGTKKVSELLASENRPA